MVQTWRELLGEILKDPNEVQRLRAELGVHQVTLTRWSSGESTPRSYHIQRLLSALPKHRERLVQLMTQEAEGVLTQEDTPREIPSSFYAHILRAVSLTPEPESARFWSICTTILQQGLQMIDPERWGVELSVIRCMPGEDGYVHSLRESVALGTHPWSSVVTEKNHFLGVESLPGHAVSEGHQVVLQSVEESNGFRNIPEYAHSLAASPIRVAGHVSGCLQVSSLIPNFFIPNRLELLAGYADLLLHAFQREDFFDPRKIELKSMPSFREQEPYLITFHQQVAQAIRATAHLDDLTNKGQKGHVETMVRRQIIQRLLSLEDTTHIDK
jgi:hypothetical protein